MTLGPQARSLLLAMAALFLHGPLVEGQSADAVGKTRRLLVPLDSGAIHISVTTRAASVTVVSPVGTFLRAFPTDEPLLEWADNAESLPQPRPVADSVGAVPRTSLSAVRLSPASDTSQSFDRTEFRLIRLADDPNPVYALQAGNGAWQTTMTVHGAQVSMLLGALRGDSSSGASPLPQVLIGRTRAEDRPTEFGTWGWSQVERHVRMRDGGAQYFYPEGLDKELEGTVRLAFIVDSSGSVRPSSIRLIGRAHPQLALTARASLLRERFDPAIRNGRPVAEETTQDFVFQKR